MRYLASWSGGKDACLALHEAIARHGPPAGLLTMLDDTGRASRSNGVPREVLIAQAERLGVPIHFHAARWDDYEAVFIAALRAQAGQGVSAAVFGDIDIDAHRDWVVQACSRAGIDAWHPLWQQPRRALVERFLALGYRARISVVNTQMLAAEFLGRELDESTLAALEAAGVDACGENGEYHTVVTAGPMLAAPIDLLVSNVATYGRYRVAGLSLDSA